MDSGADGEQILHMCHVNSFGRVLVRPGRRVLSAMILPAQRIMFVNTLQRFVKISAREDRV
jgi:hypothetical protein